MWARAWICRPEKRNDGREEERVLRRAERVACEGIFGRRSMETRRRRAAAGSLEWAEMMAVQEAAVGVKGRQRKRRRAEGKVEGERE